MHKILKTAVIITDRAGSRKQKNDFTFISDVLQHSLSLLDKTQNKHSENRFQLKSKKILKSFTLTKIKAFVKREKGNGNQKKKLKKPFFSSKPQKSYAIIISMKIQASCGYYFMFFIQSFFLKIQRAWFITFIFFKLDFQEWKLS